MNRRQFITNSLSVTIAYGLGSRLGFANDTMADHMQHMGNMGAMNSGSKPTAAIATTEINPTQLVNSEPLKTFTPMVLDKGEGMIMAMPAEQQWLKKGAATALWSYMSEGGTLIDAFEKDRLSIQVMNHFNEDTTVHWHGIEVASDSDGHPHQPIKSGKTRTYTLDLPEDSAGTYWYHPHPYQRTSYQAAHGLAAPFIIRSHNDPLTALGIPELLLMFTAPQLNDQGQIMDISMIEQMNGRRGNVVMVNGQYQPVLSVAPNSTYRLRLLNASNARYLRLSFGVNTPLIQVGTEGGLLEKPLSAQNELLLAPAERAEVCVTFKEATTLQALPYDSGWMDGGMGWAKPVDSTLTLLTVELKGEPTKAINLPETLRPITPLGEAKVTRRFVLSENMQMGMKDGKHEMTMEFLINKKTFDMNRIDFESKVGEVELWEIVNNTDMDHPFHVHGGHFQVISIEENSKETPYPYLAWKDIINTKKQQTVRFKIKQNLTGLRMYHCHVLEHEDLGMMGQYNVL